MKLDRLPDPDVRRLLATGAFRIRIGPFVIQLRCGFPAVAELMQKLYGECRLEPPAGIADFHLRLARPGALRRLVRPQVRFLIDDHAPFAPFPANHAFPLFEWGLNWCVASYSHQYLMLHSAVVEKNDQALLLPAWPGSGKSTLCAALVHRGWRLLSDEFGMIKPGEDALIPFPRCLPLKNESIEVFRAFAPEAVMGPVFPKTRKGSVAHVKPPVESLQLSDKPAVPKLVIFPHYEPNHKATLKPLPKARAFMKLAGNAFNYQLLGEDGFRAVASIIRLCETSLFHFSDLDEAVGALDRLVE